MPMLFDLSADQLLLQLGYLDLSANRLLGTLPSSLAGLGQASHTAKKFLKSVLL